MSKSAEKEGARTLVDEGIYEKKVQKINSKKSKTNFRKFIIIDIDA